MANLHGRAGAVNACEQFSMQLQEARVLVKHAQSLVGLATGQEQQAVDAADDATD